MATTTASAPKDENDVSKKKSLKEEINAKNRFISSLPGWGDPLLLSSRAVALDRANHIKQLAEMECEYELLLEAERVASVVREHEELHPPITQECPICLEDIRIKSPQPIVMFGCCGNIACVKCREESGERIDKCPLCRAEFPQTEEESTNQTLRCAKKGRAWAQSLVGSDYMYGTGGYPLNTKKAAEWFMLAAEQNDSIAMHNLALMYEDADGVEQSNSKAQELMTKAANLGCMASQRELAKWYYHGETGFSVNYSKALYYATLSCSQKQETLIQEQAEIVDYYLGVLHFYGRGGLKQSLYLAKYYFERSAEWGYKRAYYGYGLTLLKLWENQYNGTNVPSHCAIPQILNWLRKAAANGNSNAARRVEELEKSAKQKCSYCTKKVDSINGTLKCCAKCKAAWYCGRECQVQAWKEGHKIDCIKHE